MIFKKNCKVTLIKHIGLIWIAFFLFVACSPHVENATHIKTYKLVDFKQRELFLSTMTEDVEYIKLETLPNSLLTRGESKLFGDKLFIKNDSPSSILRFDKNGKFEKRICRIGKGPGEYIGIHDWDVSPSANNIAILDMISRKLCVYDLDGIMVGHLQYDGIVLNVYFQSNDIIIFNKVCPIGIEDYPVLESYNIKTKVRDTLLETSFLASEAPQGNRIWLNSELHRFDGNLFYSIHNNDTIFTISQKQELNPYLVINCDGLSLDNNKQTEKPIPYGFFQSHEYVFFSINPTAPTLYGINKNNGDTFYLPKDSHCLLPKAHVLGPTNNVDYINDVFYFSIRQSDTWNSLFDIIDLEEMKEKGCIKASDLSTNPFLMKLNNLLKDSNEEDNPILRIIHLVGGNNNNNNNR